MLRHNYYAQNSLCSQETQTMTHYIQQLYNVRVRSETKQNKNKRNKRKNCNRTKAIIGSKKKEVNWSDVEEERRLERDRKNKKHSSDTVCIYLTVRIIISENRIDRQTDRQFSMCAFVCTKIIRVKPK